MSLIITRGYGIGGTGGGDVYHIPPLSVNVLDNPSLETSIQSSSLTTVVGITEEVGVSVLDKSLSVSSQNKGLRVTIG